MKGDPDRAPQDGFIACVCVCCVLSVGIEHQTDAHGACGEEDRDTPHPHPPHPHSIPVSLSRQGLSHLDTLSESEELSAVGAPPRRKDTPYQHQPPFTPGNMPS